MRERAGAGRELENERISEAALTVPGRRAAPDLVAGGNRQARDGTGMKQRAWDNGVHNADLL